MTASAARGAPAREGDAARGPMFSVLMASYNHSRYIVEALESVCRQTCQDFEIVIVDDGSTDGTGEAVARWMASLHATRRTPVRLIRQSNGGQSAALERGFAECRGRYVAILDSDDRWLPEKLARVREAVAGRPEIGMVTHPQLVIDGEGVRTGDQRPRGAALSSGDLRGQMSRTGRKVAGTASCTTIRADVFRSLLPMATGGFRSAADAYLTFGAAVRAPVAALRQPLGEYRVSAAGNYLTRLLQPEGLRREMELQKTIHQHFNLLGALPRNAYYMRHLFALAKLEGGVAAEWSAWRGLAGAIAGDECFTLGQKFQQGGFWTLCLLAPRTVFRRMWRWYQLA